jgi:hypothetical protein
MVSGEGVYKGLLWLSDMLKPSKREHRSILI